MTRLAQPQAAPWPRSTEISTPSFDSLLAKATTVRNRLLSPAALAWFRTPGSVWWGFAAVHLFFLAWMMSFVVHGDTFSDTEQYRQWALLGYNPDFLGDVISPWVYPLLAQLPIFAANIFGPSLYLLGWMLIVTALNAAGLYMLVRGKRASSGVAPAWFWLFFTIFMGFLSFARVEGITTSLVLVALLYAVERPVVAALLLSIATWIKVWPAAIIAPLLIASAKRVQLFLTGLAVSAAVALFAVVTGAGGHLLDFAINQGDRGMQLEATFSTPWVWLSVLNLADSRIADNVAINSTEVYGPGADLAATLMQPLLIAAALVGAALMVWALRRGAEREELLLEGSLLMVTAFIVFNKVGSPQFIIWLLPVVVAGLVHNWDRWKLPATLLMGIAFTTFIIYPLFYTPLIHANPIMAAVLTVRNVLLVTLLIWAIRRTLDLGRHAPLAAKTVPRDAC